MFDTEKLNQIKYIFLRQTATFDIVIYQGTVKMMSNRRYKLSIGMT
jgi:hypothetical protein